MQTPALGVCIVRPEIFEFPSRRRNTRIPRSRRSSKTFRFRSRGPYPRNLLAWVAACFAWLLFGPTLTATGGTGLLGVRLPPPKCSSTPQDNKNLISPPALL